MINIEVYRNKGNKVYGFVVKGHSGFSEEGSDIVCSAVSILIINTINSIGKFVDENFVCDMDEKNGGYISFKLLELEKNKENPDAELLLKTMLNGLKDVKKEYSCYINISDRRCGKC